MKNLSQQDLQKIILQVSKLSEKKDQELDRQQVMQILDDLSLPSHLLDEAVAQISLRERKKKQGMKASLIALGLATVLGAGGLFFFVSSNQKQEQLSNITVSSARISGPKDNGADAATVHPDGSEIFLRLNLKNVPSNERLPMRADWIDPAGSIVKQNIWQTKLTTGSTWETHCRLLMPADAVNGKWKTRVFLSNKLLIEKDFQVEK